MKPREVILNILKVRNYIVEDEEEFINSEEEEIQICRKDNSDDKLYIFFPKFNTKVGIFTIRQYIKEMKSNNVNNAIIVVKDAITTFADIVINKETSLVIESFKENELKFDILQHTSVPKHELLSEEEKKELFKIYNLKESNLPKILKNDNVARYFGAKKGDVFKITRPSETSGEYITYRITT
jgi:DNA-directed RNA polymerase I, II, and III subunit RPABC1